MPPNADSLGGHLPSPIQLTFDGDPMAVRAALASLVTDLSQRALTAEELGTVELVLAEALNNVVEHAYRPPLSGPIVLRCHHAANGLHVQITDTGCAMPDGCQPACAAILTGHARADLPEGGFGWLILQDLAKDVRYERVHGENRLSLRLAVGLSA